MIDIRANGKEGLLSILERMNIRVPPRSKGRQTVHCERWSICRLLATLAEHNGLDFPVQLTKRERPDFLLKSGGRYIGVEVTEAVNPEYARATTLPEANADGVIVDPSLFKWGTPPRKLNELRSIVSQSRLSGPGWEGSSVETEYADAIFDVIMSKTKKLRSKNFDRFTENWLTIYCNLVLPALDLKEANLFFVEKALNYWSIDSFSRVFVEKGQTIISYSHECTEVIDLTDIWSRG